MKRIEKKNLLRVFVILLGGMLVFGILPQANTSQSLNTAEHIKTLTPSNATFLLFKIIDDVDSQILALDEGEINLLGTTLPPDNLTALNSRNITHVVNPDLGWDFLEFNSLKEPLSEMNFRAAIAHLIPKEKIVNDVLNGFGDPMHYPLPEIFGEWVNTSANLPEYNLDEARQILDTFGYTDTNGDGIREYTNDGIQGNGTNIELELLTLDQGFDPFFAKVGTIISEEASRVGINLNLVAVNESIFITKVFFQADFDMYLYRFEGSHDPFEALLSALPRSHVTFPIDPEDLDDYDKIIERMCSNITWEEKINLIHEFQGLLARNLPVVGMYTRDIVNSYKNDQLVVMTKNLVGGIVNWWTWYGARVIGKEQAIKISTSKDVTSKNPYDFTTYWDELIWNPSKERLIVIDPDSYVNDSSLEFIPWLVKDYKVKAIDTDGDGVADSQNITLWVRDGVTWQDGEKFDARDINFTIYYGQEYYGENDPGYHFSAVDTEDNPPVISEDGMVISFINTYIEPFPEINILGSYIFPEHVYKDINLTEISNEDINAHPEYNLGTGPWKFVEHKEGEYWKYEAHENYWNAISSSYHGAPDLPGYTFMSFAIVVAAVVILIKSKKKN